MFKYLGGLKPMGVADTYAAQSEDPSTKVGAIITTGEYVVGAGFNRVPPALRSFNYKSDLSRREWKYPRTVHAEVRALNHFRSFYRDDHGMRLHMHVTHTPCLACSLAIVESHIAEITFRRASPELLARWPDMNAGVDLLREGGLIVNILDS